MSTIVNLNTIVEVKRFAITVLPAPADTPQYRIFVTHDKITTPVYHRRVETKDLVGWLCSYSAWVGRKSVIPFFAAADEVMTGVICVPVSQEEVEKYGLGESGMATF